MKEQKEKKTRKHREKSTYSVFGAAEYLGIGPGGVKQLILAGSLPAAEIAGRYRIRKADLDALFIRQSIVVAETKREGEKGE